MRPAAPVPAYSCGQDREWEGAVSVAMAQGHLSSFTAALGRVFGLSLTHASLLRLVEKVGLTALLMDTWEPRELCS